MILFVSLIVAILVGIFTSPSEGITWWLQIEKITWCHCGFGEDFPAVDVECFYRQCWLFAYLLWKNVSLNIFPTFKLMYLSSN